MAILGIDPGVEKMGVAVVAAHASTLQPLFFGTLHLSQTLLLSKRFQTIFHKVKELIKQYAVEAVAIETQFVSINIHSATVLSMVRACVMVAAREDNIPIFAYTPSQVKKAAVGKGNATKQQVQWMVQKQLHLTELPSTDAADALALALCHCHAKGNKIFPPKEI